MIFILAEPGHESTEQALQAAAQSVRSSENGTLRQVSVLLGAGTWSRIEELRAAGGKVVVCWDEPWPRNAWTLLPLADRVDLMFVTDATTHASLGYPDRIPMLDPTSSTFARDLSTQLNATNPSWAQPPPGSSDKLTVFVPTVGAASLKTCLHYLAQQDTPFTWQVIADVAPMSAAFQVMLDSCATPYFVQLDEDMLLYPSALRNMIDALESTPPQTPFVAARLYDVHLEQSISGTKIYRHSIVRNYPYRNVESCEVDQNVRLIRDGFQFLRMLDLPEPFGSKALVGLHGTHFTPRSAFERYATLERKLRRFPHHRPSYPKYPQIFLDRIMKSPDPVNFAALMGALSGRFADVQSSGTEKDFRRYADLPGLTDALRLFEVFGDRSRAREDL